MNPDAPRPLVDAVGLMGNFFESALMLALGLSTVIVFIYLWRQGSLGYDEDAAQEMVQRDDTQIQQEKRP